MTSHDQLFALTFTSSLDCLIFSQEQPITEGVITVPAFFNQAERRALIQASEMAGIKVLQVSTHVFHPLSLNTLEVFA